MELIGKYHFVTESYLLDFRGRVTIPMMGNYMLHAASSHAATRGFGFSDMTEKNTAWVLTRLAMEIYRYPVMSEPVTLYTWIDDVGRLFTQRCFQLTDAADVILAYARSIWGAIDIATRRPTMLDIAALGKYIADRPCPIEKPGKIAAIENESFGIPYQVKYSDLDINGHFNSIKYIEHLLDMFDIGFFRNKEVQRFEISYLSEGMYGMPLTLHKQEMLPDEYALAVCCEGKAICRAKVQFAL
ncbi:MAG: acyl-[acyl-carrier-protein] thioesterase [Dysgonamonadaceae bacterium]|jgi:acyl-ACP thioesterase|nr:acyl-[acyl-carrier-protein] thioesterase [Dysgonamonadaceae bacterium]